jgi:adenylate cyclase
MSLDWEAEGLLDGLADPAEREARARLLDRLHDAGCQLDQLRQAVAEDRLALLPVELALARDDVVLSARELAERTGVELAAVMRLRQALGLPVRDPDEPAFTERAAQRLATFGHAGLPLDGLVEVTRVIGQSMARIAEAARGIAAEAVRPAAASEHDLALQLGAMGRELAPMLGPMMEDILAAHLLEQVRADVVDRAEMAAGRALPGAREIAVCFADLVGFTRLGESRPASDLGAVAERLAELASAAATPPVRLVKTIGDAAMLVGPEVEPMLNVALDLVDAAEAQGEDFPQIRAGVVWGPALNRGGDWYGHTVNLASRVTGVARPSSVLATQEVRDAARERYRWSFAGQRKLKGIRQPVALHRARRPEPAT